MILPPSASTRAQPRRISGCRKSPWARPRSRSANSRSFATLGPILRSPADALTPTGNSWTISPGRADATTGNLAMSSAAPLWMDSSTAATAASSALLPWKISSPASRIAAARPQGDSSRQTFQNNHCVLPAGQLPLRHGLTFDYGLRWDYFGIIGEDQNRFSLLDPSNRHNRPDQQLYPTRLEQLWPARCSCMGPSRQWQDDHPRRLGNVL